MLGDLGCIRSLGNGLLSGARVVGGGLLQYAVVQRTNGAQFASSNGFSVGDRLSIADLALCSLLGWFQAGAFIGIPLALLGDYPRLVHVLEVVSTVPQI